MFRRLAGLCCERRLCQCTTLSSRFASSASKDAVMEEDSEAKAIENLDLFQLIHDRKNNRAPHVDLNSNPKLKEKIIAEILSRDKELFELKRQHELSMLRVRQQQERILKDQQDRGLYYEQNSNVHTFDTISVGLYDQKSTYYHTRAVERLRNFKIFLMFLGNGVFCLYLYYRYMINTDMYYIEQPLSKIGSRVQSLKDSYWSSLTEEEKLMALRKNYAREREEK